MSCQPKFAAHTDWRPNPLGTTEEPPQLQQPGQEHHCTGSCHCHAFSAAEFRTHTQRIKVRTARAVSDHQCCMPSRAEYEHAAGNCSNGAIRGSHLMCSNPTAPMQFEKGATMRHQHCTRKEATSIPADCHVGGTSQPKLPEGQA